MGSGIGVYENQPLGAAGLSATTVDVPQHKLSSKRGMLEGGYIFKDWLYAQLGEWQFGSFEVDGVETLCEPSIIRDADRSLEASRCSPQDHGDPQPPK
jgi:hypothetical protein